jgi:transposase
MRRKNDTNIDERGRWSSKTKMDAVLRLLKGEDLDTLSRELRLNAATLSSWRETLLANGLAPSVTEQTRRSSAAQVPIKETSGLAPPLGRYPPLL